MEHFLGVLTSNTIIQVIVILITIIGFPLAIIGIRKKKKKLAYFVRTNILLDNYASTITGINITHNGRNIKSLCVSRVYLWNQRNSIIQVSDIYAEKPVTIVLPESCEVLDAMLVAKTDEMVKLRIAEIAGNKVEIAVESIEGKEGAIFQILHTGERKNIVEIDGRIKDKGIIARFQNEGVPVRMWMYISIMVLLLLICICVVILYLDKEWPLNIAIYSVLPAFSLFVYLFFLYVRYKIHGAGYIKLQKFIE